MHADHVPSIANIAPRDACNADSDYFSSLCRPLT